MTNDQAPMSRVIAKWRVPRRALGRHSRACVDAGGVGGGAFVGPTAGLIALQGGLGRVTLISWHHPVMQELLACKSTNS